MHLASRLSLFLTHGWAFSFPVGRMKVGDRLALSLHDTKAGGRIGAGESVGVRCCLRASILRARLAYAVEIGELPYTGKAGRLRSRFGELVAAVGFQTSESVRIPSGGVVQRIMSRPRAVSTEQCLCCDGGHCAAPKGTVWMRKPLRPNATFL